MNTENTVKKQYNPLHLAPFQFKEGVSGNPSGRPKGSRNQSTVFQEVLDMLVTENKISGDWKTVERLMIQKQIEKALQGDSKAFEIVMDRAYGKPKSQLVIQESDVVGTSYVICDGERERVEKLIDDVLSDNTCATCNTRTT